MMGDEVQLEGGAALTREHIATGLEWMRVRVQEGAAHPSAQTIEGVPAPLVIRTLLCCLLAKASRDDKNWASETLASIVALVLPEDARLLLQLPGYVSATLAAVQSSWGASRGIRLHRLLAITADLCAVAASSSKGVRHWMGTACRCLGALGEAWRSIESLVTLLLFATAAACDGSVETPLVDDAIIEKVAAAIDASYWGSFTHGTTTMWRQHGLPPQQAALTAWLASMVGMRIMPRLVPLDDPGFTERALRTLGVVCRAPDNLIASALLSAPPATLLRACGERCDRAALLSSQPPLIHFLVSTRRFSSLRVLLRELDDVTAMKVIYEGGFEDCAYFLAHLRDGGTPNTNIPPSCAPKWTLPELEASSIWLALTARAVEDAAAAKEAVTWVAELLLADVDDTSLVNDAEPHWERDDNIANNIADAAESPSNASPRVSPSLSARGRSTPRPVALPRRLSMRAVLSAVCRCVLPRALHRQWDVSMASLDSLADAAEGYGCVGSALFAAALALHAATRSTAADLYAPRVDRLVMLLREATALHQSRLQAAMVRFLIHELRRGRQLREAARAPPRSISSGSLALANALQVPAAEACDARLEQDPEHDRTSLVHVKVHFAPPLLMASTGPSLSLWLVLCPTERVTCAAGETPPGDAWQREADEATVGYIPFGSTAAGCPLIGGSLVTFTSVSEHGRRGALSVFPPPRSVLSWVDVASLLTGGGGRNSTGDLTGAVMVPHRSHSDEDARCYVPTMCFCEHRQRLFAVRHHHQRSDATPSRISGAADDLWLDDDDDVSARRLVEACSRGWLRPWWCRLSLTGAPVVWVYVSRARETHDAHT